MTATKRMSADEKRKAILDIYHKTKSVFTEKEIVTLATKAGVNSNTIVDINQALVDDGQVDKDKIGGCNYFWSFPAKKDRILQVQHEAVLEKIESLQVQVREMTSRLQDAKRGREETGEEETRESKLRRLETGKSELLKLATEHAAQKENDPQALADLEKELKLATEAAHRWTDNVFNCKSYLTKKRGMDRKDAEKILGISSDFDYPEDKTGK